MRHSHVWFGEHLTGYVFISSILKLEYDLLQYQDAEDRTLAMGIHQALVPSLRLELFPKSTIDVFLTIIEADGIEGCVASGTVAASTALADAGIEMFGLVMSCAAVGGIQSLIGAHFYSTQGDRWSGNLGRPYR